MKHSTITKTNSILFCGYANSEILSEISRNGIIQFFDNNNIPPEDNVQCVIFIYGSETSSLNQIKTIFPHTPIIVVLESINDEILSELSFYDINDFYIIGQDYPLRLSFSIELAIKKAGIKNQKTSYKIQDSNLEKLTSREKEILSEVSKGKTNKEISTIISLSPATVRNHLYEIFKKLKVTNRTQAVSIFLDIK